MAAAAPATLTLGFRRSVPPAAAASLRPAARLPRLRHSFRLGNAIGLHMKSRVPTVFASDTNPYNSDVSKGKLHTSNSGVPEGPPLLTILAGIVVFFLVCWVAGSIVTWLVSLIINVPPS